MPQLRQRLIAAATFRRDALSTSSTTISTLVPAAPPPSKTVSNSAIVLRPQAGWLTIDWAPVWRYRELLAFLAMRDIKVRYKQTALGALWAVIQPFAMMIVLSMFFGRVIDINMEDKTSGVPYPIFLYAGLLPWMFFASTVTACTNSLVSNANMLRKVYFPRLIVPLSAVGAPLVDYLVAFVVLIGLMGWYHLMPTFQLLLLPLFVLVTIVAALGVGIGLSGLTVSFRDFRYVVPFMIQVWFFVTPVIWPVAIVDERYHWLLRLNPMGGTIEAIRASVLGMPIDFGALALSAGVAILTLVVGLVYFGHAEKRFADVV